MSFYPQDLLRASYKGVPFHTQSVGDSVGRRLAEHEYPNSEIWDVEDLGIATPTYEITGYISTDCDNETAYAAAAALRAVCQTPESGPLILPPDIFADAHCKQCRRAFEKDRQGWMAFNLEFVEAGAAGLFAPFQIGLAIRLIGAAFSLAATAIALTGGEFLASLEPSPDIILIAGDVVRTSLAEIDDITQVAIVQPDRAAELAIALAGAVDTVTFFEKSGDPTLVAPPKLDPALNPVQPAILPLAGAAPQENAIAQAFAKMTQAVATYVKLASDTTTQPLSLALQLQQKIIGLGADPAPQTGMAVYTDRVLPTVFSSQRTRAIAVVGEMVQLLAAIAMAQAFADATYTRRIDAQKARGLMVATIDEVIRSLDPNLPGDHSGIEQVLAARNSASSTLVQIIADLKATVRMELQEPMPALYLAWRIYQDPERAQELAERNDAPHPFFMPSVFEAEVR